jgi:hypothetical protein
MRNKIMPINAVHIIAVNPGASASAAHDSANSADAAVYGKPMDIGEWNVGSIQLVWASLTGTVNGVLSVQVSDDGTNWVPKTDANLNPVQITVSGASGSNLISLNGVISEEFYKVIWTPNGVTGGNINCIVWGK